MKFRKMIFVLAITTSIIFTCMLGSSYAYYTLTDGTTVNVTTGDFDTHVSVVFNESEYINLRTGVPISSSDVDRYASTSSFMLVPDSSALNGYDVAVNVIISNITIDDSLKISDFKYDFKCTDGTTTNTLKTGTGTDFNVPELTLGSLSTIDGSFNISKTYNCSLRMWLQENGSVQNDLMNKSFTGLIKVSSMYRK